MLDPSITMSEDYNKLIELIQDTRDSLTAQFEQNLYKQIDELDMRITTFSKQTSFAMNEFHTGIFRDMKSMRERL